jgi:hypothetical protein
MVTCDRQGKLAAAVTADAKTTGRFRAPSRFRATPVVEDTAQPEVDTKESELEAGTYKLHCHRELLLMLMSAAIKQPQGEAA